MADDVGNVIDRFFEALNSRDLESFRELLESPGVCVLSTIEPDTTPQSSAVWYLLGEDGGGPAISGTTRPSRRG